MSIDELRPPKLTKAVILSLRLTIASVRVLWFSLNRAQVDLLEIFTAAVSIGWAVPFIFMPSSIEASPIWNNLSRVSDRTLIGVLLMTVGIAQVIAFITANQIGRRVTALAAFLGWLFIANLSLVYGKFIPYPSTLVYYVIALAAGWLFIRAGITRRHRRPLPPMTDV